MSGDTAFWLDGIPATVLPLPDRGLNYGDGLFETLLLKNAVPAFLPVHMERLAHGLQVLGLPDCIPLVRQQLETVSQSLDKTWCWAAARVSVMRGAGSRGYTPTKSAGVRILVSVDRIDRDCRQLSSAVATAVANIRLAPQPALARIKHLNRLEQVMAAAQAQSDNMDDCLMLDHSGNVISMIAGNVFLVARGQLWTPALVDCGVAGTRRRLICDNWAPSLGVEVNEVQLTLADVLDADEVFYSNSLQAVRPVSQLHNKRWKDHKMCEALFSQYLGDLG